MPLALPFEGNCSGEFVLEGCDQRFHGKFSRSRKHIAPGQPRACGHTVLDVDVNDMPPDRGPGLKRVLLTQAPCMMGVPKDMGVRCRAHKPSNGRGRPERI